MVNACVSLLPLCPSSLYSSLFNEIVITRMTLHDLYCTLYTVLQGLCTGVVLSAFIFSPHWCIFIRAWSVERNQTIFASWAAKFHGSLMWTLCHMSPWGVSMLRVLGGVVFLHAVQNRLVIYLLRHSPRGGVRQHVPRFLTSLHVQCDGLLLWCFSVAYAVVILSVIGMQSEVEELSAKSRYVQHFFFFLWNAVHCLMCILASAQ